MKHKVLILLLILCCLFGFSQESTILNKDPLFLNKVELDSAITYLSASKKLLQKDANLETGNINLYLANAYKLKQDFPNALLYYKASEKIFLALKNADKLAETYISTGEFYRVKYDLIAAERYLSLAKTQIDSEEVSERVIAKYWNRRAAVYIEKNKNYFKSIECSEKVLVIARNLNDKELEASSLNEIGYAYENLNNPIAEDFYVRAIEINKETGNELSQANKIINLARLYHKQNRLKEIKEYLDIGFKLAKKTGNEQTIKGYNEYYFHYHSDIGDYKKALFYHKEFRKLEKAEFIRKWNADIIDAEKKYELEKKDRQIEITNLRLENKTTELKSSKRKFLFLTTLLSAFTIFAFVMVYFFKKSKKTNAKLKLLSDENEFLLSEANHRINNNLQLVIILISDELRKQPENSDHFKKVLLKVKSIATLHEHLYQKGDKSKLDISNYLNDIKLNFGEVFNDYNIDAQFNIENILLPADSATYLGLLLTELCINSIKHAFNRQDDKKILFNLVKKDGKIVFDYSDNGSVKNNEPIKPKLIDKLCKQLKIDYTINYKDGFSFKFIKNL